MSLLLFLQTYWLGISFLLSNYYFLLLFNLSFTISKWNAVYFHNLPFFIQPAISMFKLQLTEMNAQNCYRKLQKRSTCTELSQKTAEKKYLHRIIIENCRKEVTAQKSLTKLQKRSDCTEMSYKNCRKEVTAQNCHTKTAEKQ